MNDKYGKFHFKIESLLEEKSISKNKLCKDMEILWNIYLLKMIITSIQIILIVSNEVNLFFKLTFSYALIVIVCIQIIAHSKLLYNALSKYLCKLTFI